MTVISREHQRLREELERRKRLWRKRRKRRKAAHGGDSINSTSGDGGPGDGEGGDGGDGGGDTGTYRQFELKLYRDGQTYTMNNASASRRTVSQNMTGNWDRWWEALGGFDVVVYLRRKGAGCNYIISNGYADDDGGDVGYFEKVTLSIDGEAATDLIPDLGGGDLNILPPTYGDWGTKEAIPFFPDPAYPSTAYFLDAKAESRKGGGIETVGPFDLYDSEDVTGNTGGGREIGYYPEWMRASINALELSVERAEAIMRRCHINYLQSSNGSPKKFNHPHPQDRVPYELRYSSSQSDWVYNLSGGYSDTQVPGYRSIPDGSCPYEQRLCDYRTYDGQHLQRIMYYWQVLKDYDPRYNDMGLRLLNDTRMANNWEDNGTDTSASFSNNERSVPMREAWMALDPDARGAEGKGGVVFGRAWAHSVRCFALFGNAEDKANCVDVISRYFRRDPEVVPPGSTGFMWWIAEGDVGPGTDPERPTWTKSIGDEATPVNPAFIKLREIQFLAMNLPLLGMQEEYDIYVNTLEPCPLQAFTRDDPTDGSTDDKLYDGYSGSAFGNDDGYKLGLWYHLAFGSYHTATGREQGPYVDADAILQATIDNLLIKDSLCSQCPVTMWQAAVP